MVPDPFLDNQDWAYLLISSPKFYCLNSMPSCMSNCMTTCFCSYKLFWKIKVGLEIVYLPYFQHDFLMKIFLTLCYINWSNFIARFIFHILDILGNMCIVIICFPIDDIINFEINLNFLINHEQKSEDKTLNILRTKKAFQV